MACGAHINGLAGSAFTDMSSMSISMNEDGSLALSASLHEVGGGQITAMKLIVGEVLRMIRRGSQLARRTPTRRRTTKERSAAG